MWNQRENAKEEDHDQDGNIRLGNVSNRRENKDTKKLRRGFGKIEIDGKD